MSDILAPLIYLARRDVIAEEERMTRRSVRDYLLAIERALLAWSVREQRAQSRRELALARSRLRRNWREWSIALEVLQDYFNRARVLRLMISYDIANRRRRAPLTTMSESVPAAAVDVSLKSCVLPFHPGKHFKNHEAHSAHSARYYYLISSGAYTTLPECSAQRTDAIPMVRVSTFEQAGQEWAKICHATHLQCHRLARSALGSTSAATRSVSIANTETSSIASTSSSNVADDLSAPFIFVIPKTATLYFDAQKAHQASRRCGATEVRVVRSFEEAVATLRDRQMEVALN
ncbi:hypothetical protein B0H16DRAFT_1461412 [Mycena metata]|uniref:Uncharacterized protein n=1 Tax=Mycena metata TaxID=1033252 RepID=A0AAD7IRC4_9AGAR|nr:hypothetical protein B0H16DRAFT_1461412 [Mycena metata]